ncbi:MAG: SHOCT domain-containing protein [Limisphaerales bacterium]
MKKLIISSLLLASLVFLDTGCAWQVGGGQRVEPTIGQQLIDLQKAKADGAITDAEYQQEKARLLAK